jgi:phage baseplate assembly protein W
MAGQYLALKFNHPDFDSNEKTTGLAINADGRLATVEGSASVRQAILLLLSTRPGERVMRPSYGCYLYRLMFAPNDDTTAGLAIHYVRRALEHWEPRIDILSLDAERSPEDSGKLTISLEYRQRSTRVDERLLLTLDLMKGSV